MKRRDTVELLLLAAIWGGSFLFMRVAVPEFGPVALACARVIGAAVLMLSVLVVRNGFRLGAAAASVRWHHWVIAGLTSTALPFVCFCYAAQSLKAGTLAIFNASTPLFGALISSLWLNERYARARVLGLGLGFAGVVWLAQAHVGAGEGPGPAGAALAGTAPILACLCATLLYGFSTNYTRKFLSTVPPAQLASFTLAIAGLFMLVPAWVTWPTHAPSARAWACAAALAVLCTAAAYLLFFRLLARTGPTNTMSVTFLIPAFAAAWGLLFLGEPITAPQCLSAGMILAGTALSTGLVRLRA